MQKKWLEVNGLGNAFEEKEGQGGDLQGEFLDIVMLKETKRESMDRLLIRSVRDFSFKDLEGCPSFGLEQEISRVGHMSVFCF